MSRTVGAIALSLISHTNAGKTTLARTLLGRDVGEVRDAPHVTTEATPYPLIETPQGDALVLWDTPGFGDSVRLAQRLRQQGNPIGWFLSQVWDRFRNQPFYLSQLAVRNVRDDADVVLYLVNASEAPADTGYLAPELEVLEWIGRPVVVLLNQTGRPRPRAEEEADEARWRDALRAHPLVHQVLALDAFARCWVQEIVLLRALAPVVAAAKRDAYQRLIGAWQARRDRQFDQAMTALAAPIASAACDVERLANPRLRDTLRDALRSLVAGQQENEDQQRAARALAARLDAGLRESTERLIAIHGLAGHAAEEVRERLVAHVRMQGPMHQGKAAALGGVLSGALSGLAADLAAGGLSFGAGTLLGALAGAAGGAGLARGVNVLRGHSDARVRWDDELLDGLSPPPCCAISLWRTSAAAGANGGKVSTRRSGAKWCSRPWQPASQRLPPFGHSEPWPPMRQTLKPACTPSSGKPHVPCLTSSIQGHWPRAERKQSACFWQSCRFSLIFARVFYNVGISSRSVVAPSLFLSSPSTVRFAMSEVTDLSTANKQKLVSDMKVVVADAEEILRATAGVAGDKMGDLRERFGERLRDAKLRLADAEAALVDRTKAAARATDDYVHENPWRAVGVAAGIGLLLGVIIGRR
jgi:ElaB/YqjD/DUF883 family membrane-anchored ribosome-binding protein/predicted GTPase